MGNLRDEKDRKSSKEAVNNSSSNFLRLEEGHNFIILHNVDNYQEGFSHWIKVNGKSTKKTCKADPEDKGWDPDGCELCGSVKELYDRARTAKDEGDTKTSDYLKKIAGNDKAKYSAIFHATKLGCEIERDKKTKKTKRVPNYEQTETGALPLSHSQFNKLCELLENDESPVNGDNVDGWIVDFVKEKTDKKNEYPEVTKVLAVEEIDSDQFELNEDDLPDITGEFAVEDNDSEYEELAMAILEEIEGEEEEYEEENLKKSKGKKAPKKSAQKSSKKKKKDEDEEEEEEDDEEEVEEIEEEEIDEDDEESGDEF